MLTIIAMMLGEEILEEYQNYRGQNFGVDIEVAMKMTTLEEVDVDLEKDNIQLILEGMTEAVVVD